MEQWPIKNSPNTLQRCRFPMSKFVFALSAFTSRYFPWSPWSASRWLYVAHTQEKKVNTVNIRWCELQQLPSRKAFWIACAIGSRHRDIISALEVIEFSTSLVTTAYFLLTYWSRLSNVPSKSNQQSSCYWHATASCPCFSFHPFFLFKTKMVMATCVSRRQSNIPSNIAQRGDCHLNRQRQESHWRAISNREFKEPARFWMT